MNLAFYPNKSKTNSGSNIFMKKFLKSFRGDIHYAAFIFIYNHSK